MRASFQKTIWDFYRKHGRDELPWRQTDDPYKILVSEIMLQQTQVDRVIPYYRNFVRTFPTIRKLASAPLSAVLKAWQGLGYNRRARMLHGLAKEVVAKYQGALPRDSAELESFWGIGPYTAHAVAAFAYNHDAVFIETNIRTAVIHHFFPNRALVTDAEIEQVLKHVLPRGKARLWYSALMDYGAYLKKSGVKLNNRSKQYTKQSKFAGSNREARGAILRELAKGPRARARVAGLLGADRRDQLSSALISLEREGLIQKRGNKFQLPT